MRRIILLFFPSCSFVDGTKV